MVAYRPVSTRRGNRGRNPNYADKWLDDEHTAGILTSEERQTNRRSLEYTQILADHLCGRISRPSNNPFGIVVPEDTLGTVENWIGTKIVGAHRRDERVASPIPAKLAEALQELREVTADAEEDGLEVPSDMAFANAELLLKAMYRISPRRFVVYPVSDGRIAIDARGPNDRIAVLTCDSGGGALCMVTIDGEYRRAWYSTVRELPDGFIREALAALDTKPIP